MTDILPVVCSATVTNGQDEITITGTDASTGASAVLSDLNCQPNALVLLGGVGYLVKERLTTTTFQIERDYEGEDATGISCTISPFTPEMADRTAISKTLRDYKASADLIAANAAGLSYVFSGATTAPLANELAFNNTDVTAASKIRLNNVDLGNQTITDRLDRWASGDEITVRAIDGSARVTYLVNGTPTIGSGYYEFSITYLGSDGVLAAGGDVVVERITTGSLIGGLDPDAVGLFADRSDHDGEAQGYIYLSTDGDGDSITDPVIFIKSSSTSGDWSDAIEFRGDKGETGPKGDTGNTGPKGDKGDKGDTGSTGAKGDPGAADEPLTFVLGDGTSLEEGEYFAPPYKQGIGSYDSIQGLVSGAGSSVTFSVLKNGTKIYGPVTVLAAAGLDSTSALALALAADDVVSVDIEGTTGSPTAFVLQFYSTVYMGHREVITANRTYFVRTDGNDSNDGLTNSSSGAFLTIQKAIDTVAALDRSIYQVTISVQAGNFAESITFKKGVGALAPLIQGAGIDSSYIKGMGALSTLQGDTWRIKGFTLNGTSQRLIYCTGPGTLLIGNLKFAGTTPTQNIRIENGFVIGPETGSNALSLAVGSVGGGGGMFDVLQGAILNLPAVAWTITANITFNQFISAREGGIAEMWQSTFSLGSFTATGTRYSASLNGVVNTGGGGASYFPGSTAGSTATGGQYG